MERRGTGQQESRLLTIVLGQKQAKGMVSKEDLAKKQKEVDELKASLESALTMVDELKDKLSASLLEVFPLVQLKPRGPTKYP